MGIAKSNSSASSTRFWPALVLLTLIASVFYTTTSSQGADLLDRINLFDVIKQKADEKPATQSKPSSHPESQFENTDLERDEVFHSKPPARLQAHSPIREQWAFNRTRDGDHYGLTDAQCTTAFPKLFGEIDLMIDRFKKNGIKREELDSQDLSGPKVKAMIYDGELYVLSDDGFADPPHRGQATLHAINRALTAIPPDDRTRLPNCEFVIFTNDFATIWLDANVMSPPLWSYTKTTAPEHDNVWLMPDFGFYDWPETMIGSYNQARRSIQAVEASLPIFAEKVPKLYWRGTVNMGLQRLRENFVAATQNKSWADVGTFNQWDKESIKKEIRPISDFCKYQFTGHVSGGSWSGAGKYVHLCHSVFVTHQLEWVEIYHRALVSEGPEQNYVQAKDDWSDLPDIMTDLLQMPKKAKMIADNSVKVLRDRYLTPAAEACYFRRLIEGYGSISFEPEFFKKDGKTWRGTPFESVALTGKVRWNAYEWRDD